MPFKVGDKVVCNYHRANIGVVQTVTKVIPLPIKTSSYNTSTKISIEAMLDGYAHMSLNGLISCKVSTDGGPVCKDCGLRPGTPVRCLPNIWFRLATKKEIRDSKRTYEAI
jgi:hypothetical protein